MVPKPSTSANRQVWKCHSSSCKTVDSNGRPNWPTSQICRPCILPSAPSQTILRATTSITVTSTRGTMNHAPKRPTTSTKRRRPLLTLRASGSLPTMNDSLPNSFCIGRVLSSTVRAPHQPQRHLGPQHDDDQARELQQHEGYDALVDALDLDLLGRYALEIEQREPERWCQERGLQVDRHQDGEPVDDVGLGNVGAEVEIADQRHEHWQHDQGDLEPIQ